MLLIIGAIVGAVKAVIDFVSKNSALFITVGIIVLLVLLIVLAIKTKISKQRRYLLKEILKELDLEDIDYLSKEYDDKIVVKSRQTLDNYDDLKYIKEYDAFDRVQKEIEMKNWVKSVSRLIKNVTKEKEDEVAYQLHDRMVYVSNGEIVITYKTKIINKVSLADFAKRPSGVFNIIKNSFI